VEGHKIVGVDDLARYISAYQPGDTVTLEVLRDGKREQIEVKLGKRPGA
jgi:S1-C subfamily serine protease